MLQETAYAKINLTLHVVGKRADGYHLLDSLVVFAGVGDRIVAETDEALSLQITGPHAAHLTADADNLVLRAAQALAERLSGHAGARLSLEKNLPVSSGIGGGSADAAACLRLLQRLWRADQNNRVLHQIAATLGSDVPVCVTQRPARMQGVGDILDPVLALPDYGIVLANPGEAVSTQAVFRARHGECAGPMHVPAAWNGFNDFTGWLASQSNDLQNAALRVCPAIQTTLDALTNADQCAVARMSGSGATCFGLFPSPDAARAAAAQIARPGWWVWGGAPAPIS